METAVLDLKGLNCPLPVLKARKAMRSMLCGQRIWLETTDPLAIIDIPAFCRDDGHSLIEMQENGREHRFLIEHGGSGSGQ
ncbi:MAG: sulfurtransferase TusA family protein [Nitratireductor sp.]|nr:sulfurtransferase TusA family protein [Nitratireductor sp.]MCB1455624.1 sulfurtransferase TusA family protein [Nitratireductor sp.]MCB1459191.1 sulfurtransferase TusA family protein [Nitratireductor sp.]